MYRTAVDGQLSQVCNSDYLVSVQHVVCDAVHLVGLSVAAEACLTFFSDNSL